MPMAGGDGLSEWEVGLDGQAFFLDAEGLTVGVTILSVHPVAFMAVLGAERSTVSDALGAMLTLPE